LDAALMPIGSAHRAPMAAAHAISDAVLWQGEIIAISKASGEILNLGPAGGAA
jgi:hypothetical protein